MEPGFPAEEIWPPDKEAVLVSLLPQAGHLGTEQETPTAPTSKSRGTWGHGVAGLQGLKKSRLYLYLFSYPTPDGAAFSEWQLSAKERNLFSVKQRCGIHLHKRGHVAGERSPLLCRTPHPRHSARCLTELQGSHNTQALGAAIAQVCMNDSQDVKQVERKSRTESASAAGVGHEVLHRDWLFGLRCG